MNEFKDKNAGMKIQIDHYKQVELYYLDQLREEQRKFENLMEKAHGANEEYANLENINDVLRKKNESLICEINEYKDQIEEFRPKVKLEEKFKNSEALISFRHHNKFAIQELKRASTSFTPNDGESIFEEALLTNARTAGSGIPVNIFKDFLSSFQTEKHHQSMIIGDLRLNSSKEDNLLYNREIQSEDDKFYVEDENVNPFKIDEFIVEDGKMMNSVQILNMASRQAFHNLKRKGIDFIPEEKHQVFKRLSLLYIL